VIGYEFGIISPPFIPNPAPGLGAEVSKVYFYHLNSTILEVKVRSAIFDVSRGGWRRYVGDKFEKLVTD